MRYRDKNRKTIHLPSGAQISIAKINVYNAPWLARKTGEDDQSTGTRVSLFILTNPNNGPLIYNGETARIVDKPVAGPDEITAGELDQEDARIIIEQVMEFSGLTEGGAAERATFPQRPQAGGKPPPDGPAVPLPAHGPPQATAA